MSRGPDKKPRKRWKTQQARPCKHCQRDFTPNVSVRMYCADCSPSPAFWRRIVMFGVGKREFDIMMMQQQGQCAICRVGIDDSAHVDHDHATLQVRGLLCGRCNLRLSVLENEEFTCKAREYLGRCNSSLSKGMMEDT